MPVSSAIFPRLHPFVRSLAILKPSDSLTNGLSMFASISRDEPICKSYFCNGVSLCTPYGYWLS